MKPLHFKSFLHDLSELLSEGDMENLLQVSGCATDLHTPTCQADCLSERYRSITGECNNRSGRKTTVLLSMSFNLIVIFLYFQTISKMGSCQHPVFPLVASRVWGCVGDAPRLGPQTQIQQLQPAPGESRSLPPLIQQMQNMGCLL